MQLAEANFEVVEKRFTADGAEAVRDALIALADGFAGLIVTTGGTGIGPRDETPEGTSRVLTRLVPGIAEELRRRGAAEKPAGMLTRGLAGVVDPHGAFIVNLPGSPAGVASGMPVVLSVAGHILDQVGGGDHA